ncbi:cysteinyl-tRNA synthetase, putative [Ricinus communis]|uniref:cysteine--tRNA ligase n=1 Tax=Ricinus communis TaxID=3988 RepID=B9T553_RICCO|nr:cysteinyl-tRNA synthetase, putative [Ricinus communis]|eukprot:XP_002533372.1 cysteine--tRNA ligase 2, cytoplasmic [Ricinus communis]
MAKKVEFKLYNTMNRQLEAFKPHVPGKVGMYVCGVTAYAFSHIGHARAAVIFDVLFRYLQHLGYEVTYARNFTDIDDKIIKRANESGEDPFSLSSRFCEEYLVDMDSLQCLRPTHQPRVTDHIEQIKDMITQIINNGFAYPSEGDVFFAVDKFPNYGQLSGQKLENHRAGERNPDTRKRNPADFALWKAAKPGEPSWESPWGPGRPGWHIECSAMSAQYLTFKFDIHGGGSDLIFPHHENEITQSAAACQESNVSYWIHNGHVTNNNEKMSKSLGNYFTIREVTERYHPLAVRHFLISAHYRSPLNYTVFQLESASDAIFYIYQTLQDCEDALSMFQDGSLKEGAAQNSKVVGITADAKKCINKLRDEFETKMSDDLSTSHILTGAFQDALKFINSSISMLKKKLQKPQQLSLIQSLTEIEREIKLVLNILGLLPPGTYAEILQQLKDKALKRAGVTEDDVLRSIEERAQARKNKEFSRSDQVRANLAAKGIALMDVGKETVWRPCVPVEQEQEAVSVVKDQNPPPTISS